MVTDTGRGGTADTSGEGGEDRAQLLLVGAVAIALVVIGLVVVINTVLYTENVATSEGADRANDAAKFDYEGQRGLQTIVFRVNHRGRNVTADGLKRRINRNVTNYTFLLSEVYASSSPVFVNLSYDNDSSEFGKRIVQAEDAGLNSTTGTSTWSPVDPSDREAVGRLVINLNVTATSQDEFGVIVSNGTDDVDVEFNRTGNSFDSNFEVEATRSWAPDSSTTCDPTGGRLLVDVLDGRVFSGQCSFNSTQGLEGPYSVQFVDGDNAIGKYGIVTNETDASLPRCTSGGVAPDEICVSPAVWTANVTLTYNANRVQFQKETNITVYP